MAVPYYGCTHLNCTADTGVPHYGTQSTSDYMSVPYHVAASILAAMNCNAVRFAVTQGTGAHRYTNTHWLVALCGCLPFLLLSLQPATHSVDITDGRNKEGILEFEINNIQWIWQLGSWFTSLGPFGEDSANSVSTLVRALLIWTGPVGTLLIWRLLVKLFCVHTFFYSICFCSIFVALLFF